MFTGRTSLQRTRCRSGTVRRGLMASTAAGRDERHHSRSAVGLDRHHHLPSGGRPVAASQASSSKCEAINWRAILAAYAARRTSAARLVEDLYAVVVFAPMDSVTSTRKGPNEGVSSAEQTRQRR